MPIIETRLQDGPSINWDTYRATDHLRCKRCRTVFPGRHRAEIDQRSGLCRECNEHIDESLTGHVL
jgi:hypothetical protein